MSGRARGVLVVASLVIGLAACRSPEASRARGGGPGADVGNHGKPVEIHGRVDPFHDTPRKGSGR